MADPTPVRREALSRCQDCQAEVSRVPCQCGTNCGVSTPYDADGRQHSCARTLTARIGTIEALLRASLAREVSRG